jgi:hypothetical protein
MQIFAKDLIVINVCCKNALFFMRYVRCLMSRAKKSLHVATRKALVTKSEEARKGL